MRIKKVPCMAWVVPPATNQDWQNCVVEVQGRSGNHSTGLESWYVKPIKGKRVTCVQTGELIICDDMTGVICPDAWLTPINDPDADVGDVGEEKAWTLKDVLENENV
ncbi:hypothetical protein D3C71_1565710 [compost metagenome]